MQSRPTAQEIRDAIRRGRAAWLRDLARDYRPSAQRLLAAYEDVSVRLADITAQIGDPLNPVGRGDIRNEWLFEFQAQVADEINGLRAAIVDNAAEMQSAGIETGGRFGARMLQTGGLQASWNVPLRQTVEAAVNYVDSAAWRSAVARLGEYHSQKVADMVLAGITSGKNPRQIAALVNQYLLTNKSPLNDAYNLVQTTHVYSARTGAVTVMRESGVTSWRWSSALDSRTCRACVAMHGTVHPATEVLNDHHRGRCAMVPITPAWRELGFADGSDPVMGTGVAWFAAQPVEDQQRIINNQTLFDAIRRGEVAFTPEVIVGTYENDVFGTMRRARSYREIVDG